MERELVSADQIREFVQDLVNENGEVKADGSQIGIGEVSWNEPDSDGCNWDIRFSHNAQGHLGTIRDAISIAKTRFQLRR